MQGENSPHWKGGIAPFSAVLRGIKEYQEWKALVYARDGYKCVECGSEEHIEAHHKVEFNELMTRRAGEIREAFIKTAKR